MKNDDEEIHVENKVESARDPSWIHRVFNVPPEYEQAMKSEGKPSYFSDFRLRPSDRIGENIKLTRSPELTKKILSFVVGIKTAETLYNLTESLHIQNGEVLSQAALNNWFVQPETPHPFFETLKACSDDKVAIRDAFSAMMRAQIEHIRDRLKKDFPRRAEILHEGFALHQEQRFFASIPLFLMMAEGIATEKSGKSIFTPGPGKRKGHKPPLIFGWLEGQKLPLAARIYSSALQIEHPLSRGARTGQLSRHAVLHGNSTDYGTEIFSLQAISILGLVGWVFSDDGLVFMDRSIGSTDSPNLENIE